MQNSVDALRHQQLTQSYKINHKEDVPKTFKVIRVLERTVFTKTYQVQVGERQVPFALE